MATERFTFEILCVDKTEKTVISTVDNFVYELPANDSLWENAQLIQGDIVDIRLRVKASLVESKGAEDQQLR